jgi:hypothetical protein
MRNYLLASQLAARDGKSFFGVVGIAPLASKALAEGVATFQKAVLRPDLADRVGSASYESYTDVLREGSIAATELADFLHPLL